MNTLSVLLLALALPGMTAAQDWTQFDMVSRNKDGRFLWTDAANWNHGRPTAETSVEIGDDHSGRPLHCVIPTGTQAECFMFELAEHARTQGTTLRLEQNASLTVHGAAVLSKDRESWFYVDGTFLCLNLRRGGLQVGGPWGRPDIGEPSCGHLLIGPTGVVEAGYIAINCHARSNAPPFGETFNGRATGSEIVVTDGHLVARQGLRIATTDATQPGLLRLKGKATFSSQRDARNGIDLYCGVWQIDGPDVTVNVGDVEFNGTRFQTSVQSKTGKKLGAGQAVLKLTGNGVSTIHARQLDFVSEAFIDVSNLTVPAGRYCVFDGETIEAANLALTEGSDKTHWSLELDREDGDVWLVRH